MSHYRFLKTISLLIVVLFCKAYYCKAQSELVINEIMSANVDMFVDPSFNFGGWIEIYNPTDEGLSLRNCYISNDPEHTRLHLINNAASYVPAHGYRTIWFDHLSQYAKTQVGFKLDGDGGTIYISDIKGNVLLSQSYPEAIPRVSYARTTDGGDEWGFTANPTPGSTNAKSNFATERLDAPVVSHPSSFFKTNFTAKVTIPTGCTLRYTTDGSTPTLTHGSRSTNGLFTVSNNAVLRFRLYKDGMLPSPVVTRSYLKQNDGYTLPIISVVCNNSYLYGDSLGIFVQGVNGRPGNGNANKCNWNMDWDRPVNFEYFDADGNILLSQECDISACGGWSRGWTPHSFKLTAQKTYEGGIKYFPYSFFSDKPFLRHKSLQIRNGGNDNNCRFKDPALQTIISRTSLDIDCQSYQPVLHFINGKFIGLLNMRETNNKHFASSNWGIDTDDMDQFEMSPDSGYVQKEGDKEALLRWYQLAENAADEENYAEICKLVDIDEYINYMAVEFYLGSNDWPHNNWKGYRQRSNDGRFRFVVFDLDFAFSRTSSSFNDFAKEKKFTFNDLYDTYDENGKKIYRITAEIELVTIFINMLKNDTFRQRFIDAFCIVAGCVFEPNRCKAIINELEERVTAPMALEGSSGGWWGWWNVPSPANTANELRNGLSASRQSSMTTALKSYSPMKLTTIVRQKASITTELPEARIFYNHQQLPTNNFNGYIFAPCTLTAQAPAGYVFSGWRDTSTRNIVSTELSYTLPTSGSISVEALFEPISAADSDLHPVKINEVSASNGIYANEYFKKNDWIELYNASSEAIDIAGMFISDKPAQPERYQIPAASAVDAHYSTIIPPHGYLVLWADKLASDQQLHTDFKLAAEGGTIVLTAADRSYSDSFSYMPHTSQQSAGLYPDATATHYIFSHPTPGAPNLYTSLSSDYDEADLTGISQLAADTPSSLSADPYYYTLDGMRHTAPVPGINIHHGKMILVK